MTVASHALNFAIARSSPVSDQQGLGETTSVPFSFRTTSHCFGDSHQNDAWRERTCYYRNLCFDFESREFLFVARRSDHESPRDAPGEISMGVYNYKWGNSRYMKTVKIAPRVVYAEDDLRFSGGEKTKWSTAIESPASGKTRVWIPYLPFAPSNIGHLIWDDYLTLFLSTLALGGNDTAVEPLWHNPKEDPPWATCDWIRLHEGPGHNLGAGYSNRCTKNNAKWLPYFLGEPTRTVVPETEKWMRPTTNATRSPPSVFCFRNAVTGLTAFANQGPGLHGWNPTDGLPPSAGRAPLFWSFRELMMRNAGVRDLPKGGTKGELLIFFSDKSSNRVSVSWEPFMKTLRTALPEVTREVRERTGRPDLQLKIMMGELGEMAPRAQIELARRTAIFVTVAGGGAFTAQFLPRGASIILYHDMTGEQIHRGFVDWKIWNFASSWIRPTWVAIDRQIYSEKGREAFVKTVQRELVTCVRFMELLEEEEEGET